MQQYQHKLIVKSNASVTLAVDQPIISAKLGKYKWCIFDELFHPPHTDGVTYLNFLGGMPLHNGLLSGEFFKVKIITETPNIPCLIEVPCVNSIYPDDVRTGLNNYELMVNIPYKKRVANNSIYYMNGSVSLRYCP